MKIIALVTRPWEDDAETVITVIQKNGAAKSREDVSERLHIQVRRATTGIRHPGARPGSRTFAEAEETIARDICICYPRLDRLLRAQQ